MSTSAVKVLSKTQIKIQNDVQRRYFEMFLILTFNEEWSNKLPIMVFHLINLYSFKSVLPNDTLCLMRVASRMTVVVSKV
jgi:hypothetical protein